MLQGKINQGCDTCKFFQLDKMTQGRDPINGDMDLHRKKPDSFNAALFKLREIMDGDATSKTYGIGENVSKQISKQVTPKMQLVHTLLIGVMST